MTQNIPFVLPDYSQQEGEITPRSILLTLAEDLPERTQKLVSAKVLTSWIGSTLKHDFILVAPNLNYYEYRLFSVVHEMPFLPVRIIGFKENSSDQPTELQIQSRDQFYEKLNEIFNHESTRRVISSLMDSSLNRNKKAE